MTHPISKFAVTVRDKDSLNDDFKRILEDHLPLFRAAESRVINISDEQRVRCIGSFHLVMLENNIQPDHFWITMRLNGYKSSEEFHGEISAFAVPNLSLYNELMSKYKSRERSF